MLERIKRLGWRGAWLLVAVVFLVILIAYAYPQVKAIGLQSRAGQIIAEHVAQLRQAQPEAVEGMFYCLLPTIFPEVVGGDKLDQAIVWLNEAGTIAPSNLHSNFLLGQANCLRQEYAQAITALEAFSAQRSDNKLAKVEIGFAQLALSRTTSDLQTARDSRANSLEVLEDVGFSNSLFLNLADVSFKQEKTQDALFWYEIGNSISPLKSTRLLRYALLQLVLKGSTVYPDQIAEGMISALDGELTITPADFFELSTGTRVQTWAEGGKPLAVLANNSQIASKLIIISKASSYCISILALDKPPQPTQIGVNVDFKSYRTLELLNGDGTWVQLDFPVSLDPGIHLLGVKLKNDKYIESVLDRNLYLGSISINACSAN